MGMMLIQYRECSGTLARILGAVFRRGIEIRSMELAEDMSSKWLRLELDATNKLRVGLDATNKQHAQLNREWLSIVGVEKLLGNL